MNQQGENEGQHEPEIESKRGPDGEDQRKLEVKSKREIEGKAQREPEDKALSKKKPWVQSVTGRQLLGFLSGALTALKIRPDGRLFLVLLWYVVSVLAHCKDKRRGNAANFATSVLQGLVPSLMYVGVLYYASPDAHVYFGSFCVALVALVTSKHVTKNYPRQTASNAWICGFAVFVFVQHLDNSRLPIVFVIVWSIFKPIIVLACVNRLIVNASGGSLQPGEQVPPAPTEGVLIADGWAHMLVISVLSFFLQNADSLLVPTNF